MRREVSDAAELHEVFLLHQPTPHFRFLPKSSSWSSGLSEGSAISSYSSTMLVPKTLAQRWHQESFYNSRKISSIFMDFKKRDWGLYWKHATKQSHPINGPFSQSETFWTWATHWFFDFLWRCSWNCTTHDKLECKLAPDLYLHFAEVDWQQQRSGSG